MSSPSGPLFTLAHDLRAPITVIAGTAAALRTHGDAAVREGLAKILQESHRLSRMLENRIAAAGIVEGLPLLREWVFVEEIVSDALARADSMLAGREVIVDVSVESVAHADPRMLQVVIGNLLDNALRYTTGRVAITAVRTESGVAIDVDDAGPGIPAHTSHDHGTLARAKGLAVCSAIATAHGGSLAIVKLPEHGTRIHFAIPDLESKPDDQGDA